MYQHLEDFKDLVRADNPSYSRWVKSALAPLEHLLAKEDCSPDQVNKEIERLARTHDRQYCTKANKYKDALYFLEHTYPGVGPVKVLPNNCGATATIWYLMTERPPTPQMIQEGVYKMKLVEPSRVVVQAPVEEFILKRTDVSLGVLLIHLSNFQQAMGTKYCGWKAVDHMRSVIRTAAYRNLDHCVLYIQPPAACPELKEVLPKDTLEVREQHHSGFFNGDFERFVEQHSVLVVMGFEADICVKANMFGTPDIRPDGTYPPALVNKVGVITSRPLLVNTGPLQIQTPEYGPEIYLT